MPALRPRLSANDTPYQRNEKNKILRSPRDSSVCRTRVDRLELRLALFCFVGIVYTLTFDPYHLPDRFSDVRKRWRSFLRLLNLWKPNWSRDYIYLIEGRHGDHRYHIHLVLRNSDFSPAEIRYLWKYGEVDDEPLLLGPYDTYRRTAKYWNKGGVRRNYGPRGCQDLGCQQKSECQAAAFGNVAEYKR